MSSLALAAPDLAACRAITAERARTFSFASHLLPLERRAACYAVYAFCRRADDAVDAAASPEQARLALADARARLARAFAPSGPDDPDAEVRALAWTARRFALPRAPLQDLLRGMEWDLTLQRLETEDELIAYCKLAAGTVGRALAPVLGAPPEATTAAEALGIALQLTNILRDVAEDLQRGRVYLPATELRAAGARLERGALPPEFVARQIARARGYYAQAESGLRLIPGARERLCVRAMGVLYGDILRSLERQALDPFAGRARVGLPRKLWLLAQCLFGRRL